MVMVDASGMAALSLSAAHVGGQGRGSITYLRLGDAAGDQIKWNVDRYAQNRWGDGWLAEQPLVESRRYYARKKLAELGIPLSDGVVHDGDEIDGPSAEPRAGDKRPLSSVLLEGEGEGEGRRTQDDWAESGDEMEGDNDQDGGDVSPPPPRSFPQVDLGAEGGMDHSDPSGAVSRPTVPPAALVSRPPRPTIHLGQCL